MFCGSRQIFMGRNGGKKALIVNVADPCFRGFSTLLDHGEEKSKLQGRFGLNKVLFIHTVFTRHKR